MYVKVFNYHDDRREVTPSIEEELKKAQTTQMKALGRARPIN